MKINFNNIAIILILIGIVIIVPDLYAAPLYTDTDGTAPDRAKDGYTLTEKVGTMLCEIADAFVGRIGKALAVLAVIIIAFGALFKKTTLANAIIVTVAAVTIFFADVIADELIATGKSIPCAYQPANNNSVGGGGGFDDRRI